MSVTAMLLGIAAEPSFGILLCLLLGAIHYFSNEICGFLSSRRQRLASFGAGISVAYLFLRLLPKLYAGAGDLESAFLPVLAGFTVFHLAEVYVYQHASRQERLEDIKETHSAAFFLYHFVMGALLVSISTASPSDGLLFFVPLVLQTALSDVSLGRVHSDITDRVPMKIILSSSTLTGGLAEYNALIGPEAYHALVGFVVGSMIYIVIRDSMPREKAEKTKYFLSGVALYAAILLLA